MVDIIFPIVLIFLCIVCEGFFSGCEIAFVSADRTRLRQRAQKGDKKAAYLLKAIENPERVLITTLLGTNLMVVATASISTSLIMQYVPENSSLISLLVITPIILILGEIVPKGAFQQHATTVAPDVIGMLNGIGRLLLPLVWCLEKYISVLSRLFRVPPRRVRLAATKEELRLLLEASGSKSDLKSIEKIMINRIFEFTRTEVSELMLPLIDVDLVEEHWSVARAIDLISRTGHTRIPVYRDRVDNIVGMIYSFDLIGVSNPEEQVSLLMRPAYYIPASHVVHDLLLEMKRRGQQMAIVVDEYGGAEGAIALEDILEEVVGSIEDEFDFAPKLFREVKAGTCLVHARMELNDVGDLLNYRYSEGDYVTIGGYLLTKIGHIPLEGEVFKEKNFIYTIKRATSRAIELVEIKDIRPPKPKKKPVT